jgi:hypothetical protein
VFVLHTYAFSVYVGCFLVLHIMEFFIHFFSSVLGCGVIVSELECWRWRRWGRQMTFKEAPGMRIYFVLYINMSC